MSNQKHTHKLRRHTHKTGNQIYFCALPDCSFKVNTALALGKSCICWRCGEPFIMNEYSIRLAKPHCERCHNPKVKTSTDVTVNMTFDPNAFREALDSTMPIIEHMAKPPANSLAEQLARVVAGGKADETEEDI